MKEYGGYIQLESFAGTEYHGGALALNCGRNCLAYLIEAKNIKKIYLPYFLCASIANVCKRAEIEVEYYSIDERLLPTFEKPLQEGEWLYLVNYYGQLTNGQIRAYKKRFSRIIVDNAQAFFQKPVKGVDTLYTCRKFFGVADGAYLYTDARLKRELPQDYSYDRMGFLLGRYERTANEFYSEYVANNKRFADAEIATVSAITRNLMRAADEKKAAKIRTQNFKALHAAFQGKNALRLNVPHGAFAYPLYVKNGAEIRKQLQKENIYIPTLWPDVFEVAKEDSFEYRLAQNILPIPVDQRYGIEDMCYIYQQIMRYVSYK